MDEQAKVSKRWTAEVVRVEHLDGWAVVPSLDGCPYQAVTMELHAEAELLAAQIRGEA